MPHPSLLIIEDEAAIRDMIRFALIPTGFTITEASNVHEAKQKLAEKLPDLILLDWMLPGTSGIDFAKKLKSDVAMCNIPLIMLTARAEEENKIRGLEIGADDYITKPFSPLELIARIKTVLRRGPLVSIEGIIQFHNLSLNINTQILIIENNAINLSPMEYKLLYFFMTHPERTYTREQLLDYVWGRNHYIDERTVDVQIRRLRHRLQPYDCDIYLKTMRGMGYQFTGKT
ncbi:MAG: phoB [Gammaproteobacteria bacterium]|jgi:two-component system phosphate regulon response regulator PhoB|nr:phoB [Gammaproteobacteria bacterium]